MPVDRIWELLTKKFNNEISLQELDELETLLYENQDAFQLNELLGGLRELLFKPVTDEAMKRRSADVINQVIEINNKDNNPVDMPGGYAVRSNRRKRMGIGAAVLASVLLFVSIIWFPFWEKEEADQYPDNNVNEIKTDAGSKTTINLPDGSIVVLNAGSKLTYNKAFGISSRKATLTGEAYFDVRKNPAMPFVVHAGSVDIWVKGTTFNLKAYPKDSTIEAALLTGIIELVSQKNPKRKILLQPNEKIIVNHSTFNKQASPSNTSRATLNNETISLSKMTFDPVDSSFAEIAWLQNKLIFRSEPFSGLARNMERRYGTTIKFLDDQVSELVFTGSFMEETLPEALEALKSTVPFHYSIQNKVVFISK